MESVQGQPQADVGQAHGQCIATVEGSHDKFVGVLQERYGWERERAENEVISYFDRVTTTR